MAKTTVYIALALGAQEPAYPAYVAFRSPFRFVSGITVVLPEPSPVALAEDGTGIVAVDPGVWLVDEVLPTQIFRRAVIVPASSSPVNYSQLVEVTSPVEIGYGPTWASTAMIAAQQAITAAEAASAAASGLQSLPQLMVAEVENSSSAFSVLINELVAERIVELGAVGGAPGFLLDTDPDGCTVLVYEPAPPPPAPNAPTALAATPGVAEAILSWEAPEPIEGGPVTNYSIQYRIIGATDWTTFPHPASTATSITIAPLANGSEHEARVAGINAGGVGEYTEPVTFTPGLVDGIVVNDTFARTAASLVGTNPTVGEGEWVAIGSGGSTAFSVNGARALSSGNGGLVGLPTGVVAIDSLKLEALIRLATNLTVTNGWRLYTHWIDTNNYLYVSVGANGSGVSSIGVVVRAGGTTRTLTNQFTAGTIPNNAAAADYPVSIELAGTDLIVIVNGVSKTYALTPTEASAIAPATTIGIYSTSNTHEIDNLVLTVDGSYV